MEPTYNEDGYLVDETGNEYGWCNGCGEEADRNGECCPDGEIVPYSDEAGE